MHYLGSLFSIDHHALSCRQFSDAVLSSMDKIVSINPSTNVLSLSEINTYYKEWLILV